MDVIDFEVAGPYVVPTSKHRAGKVIEPADIQEFWQDKEDLAEMIGCYVFGIRAGRGMTAWYVGKTINGFRTETFAYHKRTHYQRVLASYRSGTPILFFVHSTKQNDRVREAIDQVEASLIHHASECNCQLLNLRRRRSWLIRGVAGAGMGRPSEASKDFARMLGLAESRATDEPSESCWRCGTLRNAPPHHSFCVDCGTPFRR